MIIFNTRSGNYKDEIVTNFLKKIGIETVEDFIKNADCKETTGCNSCT